MADRLRDEKILDIFSLQNSSKTSDFDNNPEHFQLKECSNSFIHKAEFNFYQMKMELFSKTKENLIV